MLLSKFANGYIFKKKIWAIPLSSHLNVAITQSSDLNCTQKGIIRSRLPVSQVLVVSGFKCRYLCLHHLLNHRQPLCVDLCWPAGLPPAAPPLSCRMARHDKSGVNQARRHGTERLGRYNPDRRRRGTARYLVWVNPPEWPGLVFWY